VPPALFDAIAVLALVLMLVVAFRHPSGRVEAATGVVAAGAVIATGVLPWHRVSAEIGHLLPVVGFLAAILVVAEMCAVEGVFAAVGSLVVRAGRRDPHRMLLLAFLAAAVVTAVLSLDATVVLLTPVVAAAATRAAASPRPMVHACVRLANSASLLFPVSNLTNLLALPSLHLSFLGFAALMAPVWLVVLAVEYVGQRVFFARDLAVRPGPDGADPPTPLPLVPVLIVALMLAGFAVTSPLGLAPAWVAAAAAVTLGGNALRTRRTTVRAIVSSAHLGFALFVLCLGVVVAGLSTGFLGSVVHALVPGSTTLLDLLGIAVLATVLANVVNNLPATLLLVPFVAPLGTVALLAALVGLNVGSGLAYTGSLANRLWRRTLVRRGGQARAGDFHRLSALITPPALVIGVVVLWAWTSLLR
jgi:arsenical pump membrane protein